jgi:hypothetical protein
LLLSSFPFIPWRPVGARATDTASGRICWIRFGRSFDLGGNPVRPIAYRRMVHGRAQHELRQ